MKLDEHHRVGCPKSTEVNEVILQLLIVAQESRHMQDGRGAAHYLYHDTFRHEAGLHACASVIP